jgi:PAS domain S-box-containing protein
MSFRLKTILGIALIEASLLFVLVLSGLWYISSSAQNEFMQRVNSMADSFAVTTKDAVLSTDIASLDVIVKEVLKYPDVQYARIRDDQGRLLASAGNPKLLERNFKLDETFDDVDDDILDTRSIIEESGAIFGVVEIGVGVTNLRNLIVNAKKYGIGIGLFEMLLVALFSFILGGYLTRQLASLTTGSLHIAEGQFGYQIAVNGNDELARTSEAFNIMSLKVRDIYEKINNREKFWRQVINSTLDAVIVIDSNGIVKSYNLGAELMLGYEAEEVIGHNISMIVPEPYKHSHDDYIRHYHETGEAQIIGKSRDFIINRKNGEHLPINLRVTEIINSDKPMFVGVIHDISDRKEYESEIMRSLEEKEVLLKEIHHRVKNNLMVVSSILEMQEEPGENSRLNQALRLSQDRIHSMLMIHEKLYCSSSLADVDFGEYLHDLVDKLLVTYTIDTANIRIEKNIESVSLNIETATPLGLIVNELITNSLKYAFRSNKEGTLVISLSINPEKTLQLCVTDNGQGVSDEIDLKHTKGLGWKLIGLLSKQLDADIKVNKEQGFSVCLLIKELNYNVRVH